MTTTKKYPKKLVGLLIECGFPEYLIKQGTCEIWSNTDSAFRLILDYKNDCGINVLKTLYITMYVTTRNKENIIVESTKYIYANYKKKTHTETNNKKLSFIGIVGEEEKEKIKLLFAEFLE